MGLGMVAKTIDSLCVFFNGGFVLQISLNKVTLGLWCRNNGFVSLLRVLTSLHTQTSTIFDGNYIQ